MIGLEDAAAVWELVAEGHLIATRPADGGPWVITGGAR